ncbi:hypothetical protein HYT55_03835 [Candidatus Woesearchaeota archaeon]|nr:hypothetical protein [Candidatus Woesearchaeota archaeon]
MILTELTDFLADTIRDSVQRHHFPLSEAGQHYLQDMLTRFVDPNSLFQVYDLHGERRYGLKPITFQQFEAWEKALGDGTSGKELGMQQVAERCLFLVGFCYDYVRRNGVGSVRFHRDTGAVAYDGLGVLTGVDTFPEIAASFDACAVVVGDLHVPELKKDSQKLKKVLDRWVETRDRRYGLLIEAALGPQNFAVGYKGGVN